MVLVPSLSPPRALQPATLSGLIQSIRPAPIGVPAGIWNSALPGPIHEFLSRPGKRFRSRLVELSWQIAGRDDTPPTVLPQIVELLHAGSLIVDDIEDDSLQRRGRAALHRQIGLPLALNAGNWLYFWPLSLLGNLGLPRQTECELYRRSIDCIRQCHEGQALDLTARVGELHPSEIHGVVHTISAWKTGSLMALSSALGAIAAGAQETIVNALIIFGERLGVGLQMQNDLSELTGSAGPLKHPEDLVHGRVTWPWAWAADRLSAGRFDALQARGARLVNGIGDAAALARDLLAALGDDPRAAVNAWLCDAFSDLSTALPAGPGLDELKNEVYRLKERYT